MQAQLSGVVADDGNIKSVPPISGIDGSLDMKMVEAHIRFFTNLSSRVSGYPECDVAASYIYDVFSNYNLTNVQYHLFNVTVPVVEETNFTLLSPLKKSFSIYPMEPNFVVPSTTPGITGHLIYAGDGYLEDFDNKTVEGSIVLMKYNTGYRWINAGKLGAKAVIFIEPDETSSRETNSKSVKVPVNFPRFYIKKQDATELLSILHQAEGQATAYLSSRMIWQQRTARNVIGFVNGTTKSDQIIVLSAYYDSYSVTPSLAPGASEATGISVLLELARVFQQHPAKYTLMFVAFSGHNQHEAGSRMFVEDFFFGRYADIGEKIILQINLDLSTGSSTLAVTNHMWSGEAGVTAAFLPFKNYVVNLAGDLGVKIVDGVQLLRMYAPISFRILLDSEPLSANEGPAFSLLTVFDARHLLGSPLDTYDRLNLDNLRVQAEAILTCLENIAADENLWQAYLSSFSYSKTVDRSKWAHTIYISGQVAIYNNSIGWYSGVPNALVSVHTWPPGWAGMDPPRYLVATTDNEGRFCLPQLPSAPAFHTILSFKLNLTTGNPIYAPDFGTYAYGIHALSSRNDIEMGFSTVFNCASAVLFDLTDPTTLQVIDSSKLSISILEHETQSSPDYYGYSYQLDEASGFSAAVFFLPPEIPCDIVIQDRMMNSPLGFLINASKEYPDGIGYKLEAGTQHIFVNSPLQFAENIYWKNLGRISICQSYGLGGVPLEKYGSVNRLIVLAKNALEMQHYKDSFNYSVTAWSTMQDVYSLIKDTITDTIAAVPFFAFLVVPFTFLAELFFFKSRGLKRIIILCGTFTLLLFLFYFFHPGFMLSSNLIMLISGVVVIFMVAPVFGIALSMAGTAIKELSVKIRGRHFVEISRGSAVALSFSAGIENMRKRKLRTTLTLITVIIIVLALVIFTSISSISLIRLIVVPGKPEYQGLYVNREEWKNLPENLVEFLEYRYGDYAMILPRTWLYTVSPSDSKVMFNVSYGDKSITIYAMLGLRSGEFQRIPLIQGSFFLPNENRWVCIITQKQADLLGISTLPAEISIPGLHNFTVIGIIDGGFLDAIMELNNEPITPWNRLISGQYNVHVESDSTLIIPYKTSIHIGGGIKCLSIVFKDNGKVIPASRELSYLLRRLDFYVGSGETISMYTYSKSYMTLGWQIQIVPLILGAIIILNTMIGAIYERLKDIFIYSSLGLSPLHVASMFITESLIYAILGGVLGYLGASGISRTISILWPAALPSANYSSINVAVAIGVAMLTTMFAAIYPSLKASKLVTPSLERRWKPPTTPREADWLIPMPFTFYTDREISGLLAFLTEYLKDHETAQAEVFYEWGLQYEEGAEDQMMIRRLNMNMRLAPYERGIQQKVSISIYKKPDANMWNMEVFMVRTSGDRGTWLRSAIAFIDMLRKQLLIWRSLKPEERETYAEKFKELKV